MRIVTNVYTNCKTQTTQINPKFREHKLLLQQIDLKKRFNDTNPKKAKRCDECGNFLDFDVYGNKENQEIKKFLKSGNFCKIKWCVMCAWRKSKKLLSEFQSVLEQIEAQHEVKYLFLTLTIKNPPLTELRETIKHMSNAFHKMTKEPAFKKNILGYVRAIEFLGDQTKSGEAHPHFHTILVVSKTKYYGGNYINQATWTQMWKKALKADYEPIVDIRKIRAKNKNYSDSISALFETLKYCIAPLELAKLSNENFQELDKQTKGIRQYNKGGLLKEIEPIEHAKIDDELWEYLRTEYQKWVDSVKDYKSQE